jgi:peptidoglycan hydrolase CwlO-like protein
VKRTLAALAVSVLLISGQVPAAVAEDAPPTDHVPGACQTYADQLTQVRAQNQTLIKELISWEYAAQHYQEWTRRLLEERAEKNATIALQNRKIARLRAQIEYLRTHR